MKKILYIAVISASLFSCSKERTCTCTDVTTVGNISTTSVSTDTYGHISKNDAIAFKGCASSKSEQTFNFAGTSTLATTVKTCTLK
jgi:hypothetical protein